MRRPVLHGQSPACFPRIVRDPFPRKTMGIYKMAVFTYLSTYLFSELSELKSLRHWLLTCSKAMGVKGEILLSGEGIYLCVVGVSADIEAWLKTLQAMPGLEELRPQQRRGTAVPFSRMRIRIVPSLLDMGEEEIHQSFTPSAKISARELQRWFDEKREFVLLDVRNESEIQLGTFQNSVRIGIEHFRQFTAAARRLPTRLKHEPLVVFCTGGIRSEKAVAFMAQEGFSQLYPLEGGILKYIEEFGKEHFIGECDLLHEKPMVDPARHGTQVTQCGFCSTTFTEAARNDPRYLLSTSCPYCHKPSAAQMVKNISARHEAIREATNPLPGSVAYDNHRPVRVPAACDGMSLLDFLCTHLDHIAQAEWLGSVSEGRILNSVKSPAGLTHIVRAGEIYFHLLPQITEPDVNAAIRILYEDEAIIVIDKPAPLPLHPCGRFNRNTLQSILHTVYHPQNPRPAHRLDANTTGLVVFTRIKHAARRLQPQFTSGEVQKTYLVKAQGHPSQDVMSCDAPISVEPGEVGNRFVDQTNGLPARTLFEVMDRSSDGNTLLQARPLTGRTNQIRVHLWELGFPICGDPVYLPGKELGFTQTLTTTDPPLCLHAWKLSFRHPVRDEQMTFRSERPAWAAWAEVPARTP